MYIGAILAPSCNFALHIKGKIMNSVNLDSQMSLGEIIEKLDSISPKEVVTIKAGALLMILKSIEIAINEGGENGSPYSR
jgi:hypothetical protein